MQRLLLTIGACLLAVGVGISFSHAQFSQTLSIAGSAGGGSTWTLKAFTVQAAAGGPNTTTGAINTTGADLIVACTASQFSTLTFSDSASNTWNKIQNSSGSGPPVDTMWWVQSPTTSASQTFTATSGSFTGLGVLAFSGSVASPLDQSLATATTSTGTSLGMGSITPTVNNEMLFACLSIGTGAGATSINNGTLKNFTDFASGTSYGVAQAYYNQTTAAAVNQTFTWTTGAAGAFQGVVASFKP